MSPLPFVGRDKELSIVNGILDQPGGVHPWVVEVTGDPGIGKSRLLEEAANLARRRGLVVLAGRVTEVDRSVPFALWVDALTDHLLSLGRPWVTRSTGESDCVAAAIGTFPAFRPASTGHRARNTTAPLWRCQGFRMLLEQLATPPGLVLILEDAHWADDESIHLVEFIAAHRPSGPVAVMLAYRPRQAPARLRAAMANAVQRAAGLSLALSPLAAADADRLLGEFEDAERSQVRCLSAGVPLYLEMLMYAMRAARCGDEDETADRYGPAAQIVRAELEQLSRGARLAGQAASVAGDPFDVSLIVEVAPIPERHAIRAIGELTARDVIRSDGTGGFRYRHPLVRDVVYRTLDPAWRRAAHARAFVALDRLGLSPVVCAPHAERAAVRGDLRAATVLAEAAAGPTDPAAAARWSEAARRLSASGPAGRRAPGGRPDAPRALLTTREREIATLVTEGCTNKHIARRLGLSEKTIEAHLARAFAKLGVTSRAALASAVTEAASGKRAPGIRRR